MIKESYNTTRKVYCDGRGFIHKLEGDVNVKVQARLVGRSLEFHVKDSAIANRLGRQVVLISLIDLLELAQEVVDR